MRLYTAKQQIKRVWEVRESRSGRDFARARRTAELGRLGRLRGRSRKTWRLPPRSAQDDGRLRLQGSLYGHFGHGCVHTRINFDLQSKEGIAKFRKFMEEAADLVVSYGGSISGEHGDGQARGELLPKMFGPELVQAFREFKSAWDPEWKMNPGKLIEPYKLDENLRLGAAYSPWEPKTNFQFLATTAASRRPLCAAWA